MLPSFYGRRLLSSSLLRSSTPLRCLSSAPKELSLYQKLQKWLQPFLAGSKGLYLENKEAWALRRRIKESKGQAQLTRREMLLLRQAHLDLLKSLPILAFFCVPVLGYAAPLLGYQFPKQLLPWQFWRPDQRTQFFQEDVQTRAKTYPELVQLLQQIQHKDDTLQEMLAMAKKAGSDGLHPTQVTELTPFFEGPAALSALSSKHVHVLAEGSALFPSFAVLNKLLMRTQLVKRLEWRMEALSVDDQQLLTSGLDDLSLSELEFACHERGIITQYGEIEMLRNALKEWLRMYDTDHFDPNTNPQRLPSSLMLHAPALSKFSKSTEDFIV
ncbi:Putative receptor CCR1 [Plasmopara halstedii]|uniref:Putative receptor CCR1 n=1 Tax=Plasmopara halstedii TaxID=4781 RepID=A0A0P1AW47_PLAHL|nr:Putative receptor CCR1 [Plasmopara halstedii]CEG45458.1 Putative receptor CCR1 [Plasmopara halstedii]|eukprot:XP_024581827.1 Putative receptor CCR1 [Plasmopara halstedii]